MPSGWGHGPSIYWTSWIPFTTKAVSSTALLRELYYVTSSSALNSTFGVTCVYNSCISLGSAAQPKGRKDLEEIEQAKWVGNTLQLTFSYCFLHLRGILEVSADVLVRNFPFPCQVSRYSFQFKFQGTSSNNTCSSPKDRVNSLSSCYAW